MLSIFLEYGIDAVMGPLSQYLEDSVCEAEQRSGKRIMRIYTPAFDLSPNAAPENNAQAVFDQCAAFHATFCMPHQSDTDALVDRRAGVIRDLDQYTRIIPGLSTHMPDAMGADVENYIQPYNSAGFLMQVEAD